MSATDLPFSDHSAHVRADAAATARYYRGDLTVNAYNREVARLVAACETCGNDRSHRGSVAVRNGDNLGTTSVGMRTDVLPIGGLRVDYAYGSPSGTVAVDTVRVVASRTGGAFVLDLPADVARKLAAALLEAADASGHGTGSA